MESSFPSSTLRSIRYTLRTIRKCWRASPTFHPRLAHACALDHVDYRTSYWRCLGCDCGSVRLCGSEDPEEKNSSDQTTRTYLEFRMLTSNVQALTSDL